MLPLLMPIDVLLFNGKAHCARLCWEDQIIFHCTKKNPVVITFMVRRAESSLSAPLYHQIWTKQRNYSQQKQEYCLFENKLYNSETEGKIVLWNKTFLLKISFWSGGGYGVTNKDPWRLWWIDFPLDQFHHQHLKWRLWHQEINRNKMLTSLGCCWDAMAFYSQTCTHIWYMSALTHYRKIFLFLNTVLKWLHRSPTCELEICAEENLSRVHCFFYNPWWWISHLIINHHHRYTQENH